MSESTRFTNLSPCFRSSTASTSCSPRSLNALTRFEPMKPAAPVTTIYMLSSAFRSKKFVRQRNGGAELADHYTGCAIGDAHRFVHRTAAGEHYRHGRDDCIARAADVGHFARLGRHVQAARALVQRHAIRSARHQQRVDFKLTAQPLRPLGLFALAAPCAGDIAEFVE